jgi:RHS repeat-associated protein
MVAPDPMGSADHVYAIQPGTTAGTPSTHRGYTGHEHLDRGHLGLIHANARIYDPTLGVFLSPDPFIQAPHYTQSHHRYSYTFNNPLKYTDPSGYTAVYAELPSNMNNGGLGGFGGLNTLNGFAGFGDLSWASSPKKEDPQPQETIIVEGKCVWCKIHKEQQLRELSRMQERAAMLYFYRWASWGMMLQQRGQLVVRVVVARAPGALLRTGGRAATGAIVSGPAAPVVGTIVLIGGAAYEIIGIGTAISEAANQQEQQASEALGAEQGADSAVPSNVGPGPNAGDSVPAGPTPRPTKEQQDKINEIGNRDGCHTCGTKKPGTKSGNWIGDHQDPKKLNPQCQGCSNVQGGHIRWLPKP